MKAYTKMKTPLAIRCANLLLAVFAVVLLACEKADFEKEVMAIKIPVEFDDGFRSLMAIDEVANRVGVRIEEVQSLIRTNAASSKKSHQKLSLEWFALKKNKAMRGISGELQFEFLYGRLGRMVFIPDDPNVLKELRSRYAPKTEGAKGDTSNQFLKFDVGEKHVVWYDSRLIGILERGD
jgi:hypothetical protein